MDDPRVEINREVKPEVSQDVEAVAVEFFIRQVLFLKADCLDRPEIVAWCNMIEKQLWNIKKGNAILEV